MHLRLLALVGLAGLVVSGCASGDPGVVDAGTAMGFDASADGSVPAMGDAGPPCTTDEDCEDGVACNGLSKCGPDGLCQPATPVECDDGVGCTVDSCVEPDGACNHGPDDLTCTVGLVCDPVEGCTTPTPSTSAPSRPPGGCSRGRSTSTSRSRGRGSACSP